MGGGTGREEWVEEARRLGIEKGWHYGRKMEGTDQLGT